MARADQVTNGASVSNAVGTLPIAHGGTGATTAGAALTGLGAAASGVNTDITSLQAGVTTTTPAVGDSSTIIPTTAFVGTAVTNAINAVNPAVACNAATTAILPNSPIYANGAAGIGATITTLTTNTPLVTDGHTMALNELLLVKDEAGGLGAAKNGLYKMTTVPALGVAWVLTRSLDYDQPSDINNTGAIPVITGTANASTTWVTSSSVATVGTDAITFAQFSYAPSTIVQTTRNVSTGSGLTGGGNLSADRTISISAPVSTANGGTGVTTAPTNGQVLVGNTASGNYAPATVGSGTGISTTTGANTLTINNTGVTSFAVTAGDVAVPTVNSSTGSVTISPPRGASWDPGRTVGYTQVGTYGGGAFSSVGIAGGSLTGGAGVPGGNARSYIVCTSGAVSGNLAGATAYGGVARELNPILTFVIQPVTTTSVRYWIGGFASAPDASDTIPNNSMGFRYSTVAGDTNWQCISSDGTTAQVQDSGIAFSATRTILQIDESDGTNINFYINGTLVKTNSTRVPVSTTGDTLYAEVVTQTTAAAIIRLQKLMQEKN